jgi:hypothetical protein
MKASTGLRNYMLASGSLKDALDGGEIRIYAGTVPATADAAIGSATLLCTITLEGGATGITFAAAAAAGVLQKNASEEWSGTNADSGTATFFRHVVDSDDGSESTTALRIQGTVNTVGADLNLSSTSLVAAAEQTIDYYSVAIPTL